MIWYVQAKDVKKAGTFDCPVYRVKQRRRIKGVETYSTFLQLARPDFHLGRIIVIDY